LSMVMRTLGLLSPVVVSGLDSLPAAAGVDPVHTLAPSSQRMPALPQSVLVSGWLEVLAASTVEDLSPDVEFDSVHTLAPSFQRMSALAQSALVSGWLEVSAASTVEPTIKAPKAEIEAIAFMTRFMDQLVLLMSH